MGEETKPSVFRKVYRELSDEEKAKVESVKDAAETLYALFAPVIIDDGKGLAGKSDSREMSLARTKLEESVMWAVKSLTA